MIIHATSFFNYYIKTFKANLYSSEKHFIFNNVLLMNRRLALKVFIIDKETSGKWIIKNKALVPWRALGTLFLIIHLPSVFIYYLNHMIAQVGFFFFEDCCSLLCQWATESLDLSPLIRLSVYASDSPVEWVWKVFQHHPMTECKYLHFKRV